MNLSEEQAINYLSGFTTMLRIKIMATHTLDYEDEIFISQEDKILCDSLELVLMRARENILFNPEKKIPTSEEIKKSIEKKVEEKGETE